MTKLNQIIAVANGKKTQCEKALTDIYQKVQKPELFSGLSRTYKPLDEEGETLPKEEKFPQFSVNDAINSAKTALSELINVVATQDYANTNAVADVVVNGTTVLNQVPVTHLLFLEKQLIDINTFVSKLPVLDSSERWTFNNEVDMFSTEPSKTNRNVKRLKNHIKAEATEKHPAQVEVYSEDVKVGEWSTIKFSTAVDAKRKNKMLSKIKDLQEAVKFARENANMLEVKNIDNASKLLGFIFE